MHRPSSLTEAHLGLDVYVDSSDVASDETIDGAKDVGNVEGQTFVLLSIGHAFVVLKMGHASDGVVDTCCEPTHYSQFRF